MPAGEIRRFREEGGHYPEPAAGFQQLIEAGELFGRVVKVLGGLGAGDEVVFPLQYLGVAVEKGVVEPDAVSGLLEDPGQGRPRSAAVVETLLPGGQPIQERSGQAVEEFPVARIRGVVFVE